jgi:hypothetical protein
MEIVVTMIQKRTRVTLQWTSAANTCLAKQAERNRVVKAIEKTEGPAKALNRGIRCVSRNHIPRAGKPKSRTGLRMRGHRGHPEVRLVLNQYAQWLRKAYVFPIRVPVYLYPSSTILNRDGAHVVATFLGPFDQDVEPYIRLATGDYPKLKRLWGRNDALAEYVWTLSHEVVHYNQWLETGTITERGVVLRARSMLRRYAAEVRPPFLVKALA